MSAPRSHKQDNPPEPQFQAARQQQVESLADAYLERLLAGETPDRHEFLAAHAELADLLSPRLELVELMHRVARGQQPAAGKSPNPAPGERVLRVKCPHCGNGIQLVEPESTEVTCSGCGSSFHVEPGATTSFHPAAVPRSIGRFEVLEQLGRGAFGIVYKARDPQLQRLVAVKVPRAGSFATPEEEERFLREARAAAQLNHPGIVPVLEIAHDRNSPYIVSGYIEGLTLADLLTARRPSFRETAELTAAVADALDFAHRSRIVHRDIKPSNLLLDDAGRPHVADFGLARRGEPEITVTLDGQILGTPAYMSPEQAAGDQQHVDGRSDVYSLGVVLYELLTGELPFRGNQRMLLHQVIHDEPRPPRSLNDRVPRDLETICLKAMAKVPNRRYASAREMADDLRRFLNGEAIRARRVRRAEKLARWVRRNPQVAALTATVALLLIAVAAGELMFVITERRLNRDLSNALDTAERNHREAELRAASAAVDLDLKHCEDGEIEYGVLRLARTLGNLPPHATELRQCVEMNLLAWAQEIRPLGPTFLHDGAETMWELSPDGLTVLTGGADGTARLWDAFTGEVRATMRGHRGNITSIGFSHNGRVAMTVGEDRIVRLWETSNGQLRGMTREHPKQIEKALLSPDGGRLLSIFHEKGVQGSPWSEDLHDKASLTLWGTATGKRIAELEKHAGYVNDAVFSPDGQTLLTGGVDRTARLWSAKNGAELAILQGQTGLVMRVAFSSDGEVVATLDSEVHPKNAALRIFRVRRWNPKRALQIAPPCISEGGVSERFRFLFRDVVVGDNPSLGAWHELFIQGMNKGIVVQGSQSSGSRADGTTLFDSKGRGYDRTSGKLREVPLGRKYHQELARFAAESRIIVLDGILVDLLAEKAVGGQEGRLDPVRFVPDRHVLIGKHRAQISPSYWWHLPTLGTSLDPQIARLFAEVVTCHELDPTGTTQLLKESDWEERRRKLVEQLDKKNTPSVIRKVASDPWFWLRRQADRGEDIKYLERLISVEPTWQKYHRRAGMQRGLGRRAEAVRDFLEAGRLAGEGYWYGNNDSAARFANDLILEPAGTPEQYRLGLRLAEALSRVLPDNRYYRVLVPIALYRLGRYGEALPLLQNWQREWQRSVVSRVGQYFLLGSRAELLEHLGIDLDMVRAMAYQSMTLHRLGQIKSARAVLADLRMVGEYPGSDPGWIGKRVPRWDQHHYYPDLLREAETLIEGKPRPGK